MDDSTSYEDGPQYGDASYDYDDTSNEFITKDDVEKYLTDENTLYILNVYSDLSVRIQPKYLDTDVHDHNYIMASVSLSIIYDWYDQGEGCVFCKPKPDLHELADFHKSSQCKDVIIKTIIDAYKHNYYNSFLFEYICLKMYHVLKCHGVNILEVKNTITDVDDESKNKIRKYALTKSYVDIVESMQKLIHKFVSIN